MFLESVLGLRPFPRLLLRRRGRLGPLELGVRCLGWLGPGWGLGPLPRGREGLRAPRGRAVFVFLEGLRLRGAEGRFLFLSGSWVGLWSLNRPEALKSLVRIAASWWSSWRLVVPRSRVT